MVMRPLMKKTPKIQEAISPSESPPLVPTARMIATGAVTAKSQPMKPLDAYNTPKSEKTFPAAGALSVGRSMWVNMEGQGTGGRNPDHKLIKRGAGDKARERAVVNSGGLECHVPWAPFFPGCAFEAPMLRRAVFI